MHTTSLRKVGGSVMLAVPPALLDALHLQPGAKLNLAIQEGKLVIDLQTRPRYALAELLARCHPRRRRSKQEREWLGGDPVGAEVI